MPWRETLATQRNRRRYRPRHLNTPAEVFHEQLVAISAQMMLGDSRPHLAPLRDWLQRRFDEANATKERDDAQARVRAVPAVLLPEAKRDGVD